MDTIDLKIFTDREILAEDIEKLKELKMVNGVKIPKVGKTFVVSFPRYYYKHSNAYLITKERELQLPLEELIRSIEALGYRVQKVELLRGDYPFTHIRSELETFKGWGQAWRFLGACGRIGEWSCKEIGQDGEIETFIIQDTFRSGSSRGRIIIYNQALKLEINGTLELSLRDFPDLKNRSRIEVSQRIRKNLVTFKGKMLKDIKTSSYDLLENAIFNNIENAKEEAIKELTEALKSWRKEKGKSFRLFTFIQFHKFKICDYTILREAIKRAYESKASSKKTYSKAKKYLQEIEKREGVYYLGNLKRIEDLRIKIKKEAGASTR